MKPEVVASFVLILFCFGITNAGNFPIMIGLVLRIIDDILTCIQLYYKLEANSVDPLLHRYSFLRLLQQTTISSFAIMFQRFST